MKTKIIPFDLETAKKIQAGEIEGRIRTKDGDFTARIICFDKVKLINGDGATEKQIVSLTYNENAREDVMCVHNQKGEVQASYTWQRGYDLVLEVPDNEPQFKPFDKVLVRNKDHETWNARLYDVWFAELGLHGTQDNKEWKQCVPYEGNEHLVGTTDKPKED